MTSIFSAIILINFILRILAEESWSTREGGSDAQNISEIYGITPSPSFQRKQTTKYISNGQVMLSVEHLQGTLATYSLSASPAIPHEALETTGRLTESTADPVLYGVTPMLPFLPTSASTVDLESNQAENEDQLLRIPTEDVMINNSISFQIGSSHSITPSVSKLNDSLSPGNKEDRCDTDDKSCRSTDYVPWVGFYIRVGGWLMLSIVLLGIVALVVTHILGKRQLRRRSVYSRRKENTQRLGKMSEARDKLISHLV